MFRIITRQSLLVNVLVGLLVLLMLGLVFVQSLNLITHHGESKTVPSVMNKHISEVEELLTEQGFEVVIQDSVYQEKIKPGMVTKQVPEPDDVVKVNRTVYITINRTLPPEIDMPNLIGYSFRNAEMVLDNMGLKLGDTTFRSDFAKNSVLEQLHNGNRITPGTKIRMGSSISLVIGSGIGAVDLAVPKLIGLSYEEADILLQTQGLIIGSVVAEPNIRDTAAAFIYRQSPASKTENGYQLRIRPGQMIDVWLSLEPPVTDSTGTARQEPMP